MLNLNSLATRVLRAVLAAGLAVGLAVNASTVAGAAGPAVRQTATCPSGTVVLGGGAQVVGQGSADFRTSLQESGPGTVGGIQSVWLASVRNADGTPHTIGISAVCAKTPTGYRVVRSDRTVPAGGFLRATAACPSETVILAGGSSVVGEGTADFRTLIQESAPGTVNGGAQSVWLTALRNNDTKAHTIALYAVCATKPAGYRVMSKDTTVAPGGFLRTTVACPTGTVVAGGGPSVSGEGSADFSTRVQESGPGTVGSPAQSVWLAAVRNSDRVSHTARLSAVCINPPSGYQVVRQDVLAA